MTPVPSESWSSAGQCGAGMIFHVKIMDLPAPTTTWLQCSLLPSFIGVTGEMRHEQSSPFQDCPRRTWAVGATKGSRPI